MSTIDFFLLPATRYLYPEDCCPTETAPSGVANPASLIQQHTMNPPFLFSCMHQQLISLSVQLSIINPLSFWGAMVSLLQKQVNLIQDFLCLLFLINSLDIIQGLTINLCLGVLYHMHILAHLSKRVALNSGSSNSKRVLGA